MQNNIDSAPLTERFDLLAFTDHLIMDLAALRAGKISVRDAMARAEIAKQILRSVGYVITAQKYLLDSAKPANPPMSIGGDDA
jgi:hypothetical protein